MIEELKMQGHAVKNICQVLKINRSSYYRGRMPKDKLSGNQKGTKHEQLIKQIKSEHPFGGYRRVRAYLRYKMYIVVTEKARHQAKQ